MITYMNSYFYLETEHTSYVMRVLPNGTLQHVYYGKKVPREDFSHYQLFKNPPMSPELIVEGKGTSLDTVPQEYSTFGRGDFRKPALVIETAEGRKVSELKVVSHTCISGRPSMEGLPNLDSNLQETETLSIMLQDVISGINVVLYYSLFPKEDILSRYVKVINTGKESVKLHNVASLSLDFERSDFDFVSLDGSWARERHVSRRSLAAGTTSIESRRGNSSHQLNPFCALAPASTQENQGEVYGFSLIYSADFLLAAEVDQFGSTRLQLGINPETFTWKLNAGEHFITPEALLTYSEEGFNGMSKNFHRACRNHLGKSADRTIKHPIVINSWEAMYFSITEEKVKEFIRSCKGLGVDTFVMDDGWFGHRDSDNSSLGDWFVDRNKFENGLHEVVHCCHENGLQFGIWFEPEMVSKDSILYQKHPDWCIHCGEIMPVESRNQMVLDMSRMEVVDGIYEQMAAILTEYDVTYVKWDFNRSLTDNGSAFFTAEQQGEHTHRYMLGVYALMERLVTNFPNVFFEGCASGGGRFDFGILYYMPQIWTSDDTDAVERIKIQYGTSYVYPPVSMSAHVSACPNHQTGRTTPLETRGEVAQMCNYGYEFDVRELSAEEREKIRNQVKRHRELEPLVQTGDYYRLRSPFAGNLCVWELVSEDQQRAYVCAAYQTTVPNPAGEYVKLQGLNPETKYLIQQWQITVSGASLMYAGLPLMQPAGQDHKVLAFDLVAVPEDTTTKVPVLKVEEQVTYDIDDVDGKIFMLDHSFSGCLTVNASKELDESIHGSVFYDNKEIGNCVVKHVVSAGGAQLIGIPVRSILTSYDTDYVVRVEGLTDTDGNKMKPQEIKIHTNAKNYADPAYAEHDAVALQAAEEGIVLLKNQDNTLPLKSDERIRVAGAELFRVTTEGAGRINPRYTYRLERAIQECSSFQLEAGADIALIVISRASGENYDNNAVAGEFYLSEQEKNEIARLRRECRKLVAIINSGYPMDLRWLEEYSVDAALWCGFSGMLGGKAVVEILDGRVNPSGKLPDTWSLDYTDIPASKNFYQPERPEEALGADVDIYVDTCYQEGIYVGYRYFETFDIPVAYPFGHGLSYTDFEIQAELEEMAVRVSVTNIGNRSGKEVVQVYAQIPEGSLEQPKRRLVAFGKTKLLAPKETEELVLTFTEMELKSFDVSDACWKLEAGEYCIFTGNSVKETTLTGSFTIAEDKILMQSEHYMACPVEMPLLSKKNPNQELGFRTGIKKGVSELEPISARKHFKETVREEKDFVDMLSVRELARMNVCASHGWGMHELGEAGRIYRLEDQRLPVFRVADGNCGVNVKRPNIGMPSTNLVCATWDRNLVYRIAAVVAEEAKENGINMILAPGMNIHRNPLCGRHPEYFSEDPYLSGVMAGYYCKGLEDNGISGCIKHVIANNSESTRKRNHSLIPERALREIYLKNFEVALSVHQPDSLMTAYNGCNGCFTAQDEELLQGIFREEFGFEGYVMTDWNSYDTVDPVAAVAAGNCWLTPGTEDDTFVAPIVEGIKRGTIEIERLRANVRYLLRVIQKRSGEELGVK